MPPNFQAVGPTEAELHILKVEKLDACIRPLFANFVIKVSGAVQPFRRDKYQLSTKP